MTAPILRTHQIVMLGNRTADLDDRRFLEGVGPDHCLGHLSGDADERDAVHLGVSDCRDKVRGTGATGRHADADFFGSAGNSLSGEATALLVTRQDRADFVAEFSQSLVQRHAATAWISEYGFGPLPHKALDHDVSPVQGNFGLGGRVGSHGRGLSTSSGDEHGIGRKVRTVRHFHHVRTPKLLVRFGGTQKSESVPAASLQNESPSRNEAFPRRKRSGFPD